MLPSYSDIKNRLGEPLWYDTHRVPRYDPFTPALCDIYDDYIAFMEIACQVCGKKFKVAVQVDVTEKLLKPCTPCRTPYTPYTQPCKDDSDDVIEFPSENSIGSFGYGDPPAHGCMGDTMKSVPIRILEFWRRGDNIDNITDNIIKSGPLIYQQKCILERALGWVRDPQYEINIREEWAKYLYESLTDS